jgi:hypothetical protein
MGINVKSPYKRRNYNRSALQLFVGVTFTLFFSCINAVEVTNVAGASSEEEVSKKIGLPIGDGFSGETGFSSGDGSIKETDFSKETGFSKQSSAAKPAGLSNGIDITAGVAHDSNPGSVAAGKNPVWIYSLAPRILLDYSSEVNRLYLNAELLVQRHSNEKVLVDREDPRLMVGWDRTYESGTFGINANYSESSSRGEELRTTGVFGTTDNTARTKALGAMWNHNVAPRWTVLTEGDYSSYTFSEIGSLSDYKIASLRSKLIYANSERLNTHVQLGYAQLSPDKTFRDTNLARLALGADYEFSEELTVSSRAAIYNLSGRQSDTDLEAGVKLEYNVGRMAYRAELNRELSESGAGGFQKTDIFGLGWLFNISEADKLGASYIFAKSKKDSQVDIVDSDVREIRAFYERILSGNWRGQANVSYRERDSSGTYSNGNVIGVSLTYGTLSF